MAENGNLFPVILMPKTEQQLMLGANILSKSELSRAYTSLYFTPYSQLYRGKILLKNTLFKINNVFFSESISEACPASSN